MYECVACMSAQVIHVFLKICIAHASERCFSKMTFHVECRPAKLEKHCVITSLMGGCEKLANVCIKMF